MNKDVLNLVNHLNDTVVVGQPIEIPLEYTLVMHPDGELLDKIESFITEISQYDDRHIYYGRKNLHATIYAPIDPTVSTADLHSFLLEELKKVNLIFEVQGVAIPVIVANPIGFSLFELRQKIASFLGDDRSGRPPIREQMTWMTFLRFTANPNEGYLNFIEKNRDRPFGMFKPKTVELYKNHRRTLDDSAEKVFSIEL